MRKYSFYGFIVIIFLFLFDQTWGQPCNDWLKLSSQPAFARLGDIDISGDKITVEAMFNRTAPWVGVDLYQGDLVTKHLGPDNCNYLLRPSSAEITTTNGYFKTPTICPIELNKTYHVAMVYDGRTLKFYRNGFLMSQIAASGALYQNDFQTQIGYYTGLVENENLIGYINEVRIWNVVRTQEQIKSFMNQPLPNPQNIPGLVAYYTFENLLNKQGNTRWNATLSGSSSFAQANPNCTFIPDSCGKKVCEGSLNPDFQFERDICAPKTVRFFTALNNIKSYQWDFGDGRKITGQANPSINYTTLGSYKVKLKVESNEGCTGDIEKTVSLQISNADIIKTPDTTICSGDSFTIRTNSDFLDFCWQTNSNQAVPTQLNPVVKPEISSVFTITTVSKGTNLIRNADFSSGTLGFNSDYTFSNSGITPAVYTISTQPESWNPGMSSCRDHTSGDGNMMLINGSSQINQTVWKQTVSVKPNTEYALITWMQTLSTINPARLQFFINGVQLGNNILGNTQSCVWDKFQTVWNSGINTSASIEIVNLNQAPSGNDFALDDIFFGELTWATDNISINVNPRPVINLGKDTTVCKGATVQLNAKVSQGSNVIWSPASYLNSTTIPDPYSVPVQSVTYIAEAFNQEGCSGKDTIAVQVIEPPELKGISDTTICEGESVILNTIASTISTFQWQPTIGLTDPSKLSPVAAPKSSTKYTITAVNSGCISRKTVSINIKPLPIISVSEDTTICMSETIQLNASGGELYKWYPTDYLSSEKIANPIAGPVSNIKYKVEVTGSNGCVKVDSLSISVRPKPSFSVYPLDATVCYGDTVRLIASGGDFYKWFPSENVLSSNSASTLIVPVDTKLYHVIAEDKICHLKDTLTANVNVKPKPVLNVQKSNDIDCVTPESRLFVTGANSYVWESGPVLSDIYSPYLTVNPRQTTTYYVKGTSIEGCSSLDSMEVKVLTFGKNEFFLPSAFTPNRDNLNDCLGIKYWGTVTEFSMKIFNRWGQLVFSTENPQECWNGKYKSVGQPEGIYVYIISAKTLCGNVSKKGTISLLR